MQVYNNSGSYESITYDSVGNPLSYYNGMNFSWEMGRQLAGITTDSDTIDKIKMQISGESQREFTK